MRCAPSGTIGNEVAVGFDEAVRFDDMLATVLARPLDTPAQRLAAWRQTVDVLAQRRSGIDGERARKAYDRVRALREQVPAPVRAETAAGLAGRSLPADLVLLFAEEPGRVAAPILARAILPPSDWMALLPRLTPTARALLRNRRDLDPQVAHALNSFGTSDFGIGTARAAAEPAAGLSEPLEAASSEAPSAAGIGSESQIQELMARIAAFRRDGRQLAGAVRAEEEDDRVQEFRFETGADGIVIWVDGAPRGALIGQSIAVTAESLDHGVDGHAAGAFRRRAPFRDARLLVAGNGPASGEWRISAVPFFETGDGRFTGYRGSARRPRADETAERPDKGLYGTGLQPDSLRQLVHELRTPINAIVGFAEMIERQMIGPVAANYRERALQILEEGRRLLSAVDDLDLAARAESGRLADERSSLDGAALLKRLHDDYERVASEHGVALTFRIDAGLPPIEGDPVAVERMFARLLASTIGLAEAGERMVVRLERAQSDGSRVALIVERPQALAGRDERTLLDPGYTPEGDWPDAPILGLGFALRLVRNLAHAAGGALEIDAQQFSLRLPGHSEDVQSGSNGL